MSRDKAVAIVGSRETEQLQLILGYRLTYLLLHSGFRVTSGNAPGMDNVATQAVIRYLEEHPELCGSDVALILLPWNGFEGRFNDDYRGAFKFYKDAIKDVPSATLMAKEVHPYWENLKVGGISMHTRNVGQVLQEDINTPVDLVILSAKKGSDGFVKGGTRTAHVLAVNNNVPVYNLLDSDDVKSLREYILSITDRTELVNEWFNEYERSVVDG